LARDDRREWIRRETLQLVEVRVAEVPREDLTLSTPATPDPRPSTLDPLTPSWTDPLVDPLGDRNAVSSTRIENPREWLRSPFRPLPRHVQVDGFSNLLVRCLIKEPASAFMDAGWDEDRRKR
jgi:hypothetical protein